MSRRTGLARHFCHDVSPWLAGVQVETVALAGALVARRRFDAKVSGRLLPFQRMHSIPKAALIAALLLVAACGDSFSAVGSGVDGGVDSGSSTADTGGATDSSTPSEAGGDGATGQEGAVEGGPLESGSLEGSPGEAGPSAGVTCGQQLTCSGTTPVCCLGSTTPSCAHLECGCDTQLACASDLDCSLPTGVCCIGNVQDSTCGQGHPVAACAAVCSGGQSHLCDPNAQKIQCLAGKQCSTDSGDLQNVGLPPGPLYGVCK